MITPRLAGDIDRRLLVNFAVDPAAVQAVLPAPFRPQLVAGRAVAGICLIRLAHMRPAGMPAALGVTSENAAHRVAVEWDGPDGVRTGVYIPRRDSDSWLNVAVGGRLFPGVHHRADFDVEETDERVHVGFRAVDGSAAVDVEVEVSAELPPSALFADVDAASGFFRDGCDGYSATADPHRFDGLQLCTDRWSVTPTRLASVRSSFFDDESVFPAGSAVFDNALLMRRVPVQWRALPSLTTTEATASRS